MNILRVAVIAVLGSVAAGAENPPAPAVPPAGGVYFVSDVVPLVDKLGCNAVKCHGAAGGRNGFKLSMFAAEPDADYAALTRADGGRRVNRIEPLKSLFLLKATGTIAHEGGQRMEVGSPEYDLLARWVARGAPFGDESLPKLVSIEVSPLEKTLRKSGTQQLKVTAVFSDGTQKDVTRDARYESRETNVAAVNESGTVLADGLGQTAIVASYLRKFATARIVVPQTLPSPFPTITPQHKIDELVLAKLKELGVPPSDLCSDQEFLRRVYLDVIGTLPTPDEARAYLSDTDTLKRSKLIDRLLDSGEFADYWALKWGDLFRIKSEYPSNLWPNAVQAYHRWIRDSIASNKPYDQFARELITSSGSNFRVPAANYYRAFLKREPQSLAEVTALIFMGARIGCARCHAHPQEEWALDDNVELAAFFAKVRYKRSREWKEEIVYVSPTQRMWHPRTRQIVKPRFPGGDVLESDEEDPRVQFADWLTSAENPWFAKNIVNRTWFWLLGRGIVHEPDDLRSTNPPGNPQLLEYLEKELVSHKYDLKHIYRLILNSRTYQLSSKVNEWNAHDTAHFSHYYVKRLGAETLLDAIGQVTERWDTYRSRIPEPFVVMPTGFRATHLADGSIGLPFLELFGRPPRDTAFESERDLELSMRQTLHLLNSSDVQNKINASPRLRRLVRETKEDAKIVDELYLSTLSRPPREEERKRILAYMSGADKALPEAVRTEQRAAQEALAKVKRARQAADAACAAAEKAAGDAEKAAQEAKTTSVKAAAAQADAEKAAGARLAEAGEAKKNLGAVVERRQKPAAAEEAAARRAADAAATKAALDKALVEAKSAVAGAQETHGQAEKAAQEAAAKAKAVSEDAGKSAEEKRQAAAEAATKRQAADEAKAALTRAQELEEQARSQADHAAQELAEAEKEKQQAEQVLEGITSQVAAATRALEEAQKDAQAAQASVAAAKAEADKARAAQAALEKAAPEKRRLASEAKAKRDKLANAENAANTALANVNTKVTAARAALKPRRDQALQDLLWALFNTKEFVFNH